jgi:serine/threonine protein kinase
VGSQLGPYRIEALIGAGGMGEVYKATDIRLGRSVAVKLLHRSHADRFKREARAIAALNHPNICTLYDVGPDYLVMEYVEGKPLSGPLTPDTAIRLALEIAAALEVAHGKGIVHRDLKPANILVTSSGVKLLDFGLAKVIQYAAGTDATVTRPRAGTILGTSPTCLQSKRKASPWIRGPIFSFGLVLYDACGRRTFPDQTRCPSWRRSYTESER